MPEKQFPVGLRVPHRPLLPPEIALHDALLVVRLLAENRPRGLYRAFDDGLSRCALCDQREDQEHQPTCPWRLAREWVKAYGQ